MSRTRTQLKGGLAVAALMLVVTGCGTSTAAPITNTNQQNNQISSVLNVANWSDYLPHSLLTAFSKKYHVKINYTTYNSNAELLTKMQAGEQFDVIVPSDYMVQTMIRLGLLDKINFKYVPNIKNIYSGFRHLAYDPNGEYYVPYLWGVTTIAVNTKKVHTKVTTYSDLLNPEFKNELIAYDSPRTIVGMALMMNGHNINDANATDLAQAKTTLMKFRPQIKIFNSSDQHTSLLNGEAIAGIILSGEGAQAYEENPAILPVFPKIGLNKWVDNMAIPAGTPHKYTAELFINFMLNPKNSAALENDQQYSDPNKAAIPYIDKSLEKNPWINMPKWVINQGEVQVGLTGKANTAMNDIYTSFKQGS